MSSLKKNQSKCAVSLDDFKEKLDQYLESISDQPRIDGLSPGVATNSILHQTKQGQGRGAAAFFWGLGRCPHIPYRVKTKF